MFVFFKKLRFIKWLYTMKWTAVRVDSILDVLQFGKVCKEFRAFDFCSSYSPLGTVTDRDAFLSILGNSRTQSQLLCSLG